MSQVVNLILRRILFIILLISSEDEFSPLKNADTAANNNPTTARMSVYDLHRRYLEAAGALIDNQEEKTLELSPLLTYAGEGLTHFQGKHIRLPAHLCNEKFSNGS